MIKHCDFCHKEFSTQYPAKLYCSPTCARKAYYDRDESFYDFPHEPDQPPLHTFNCAYCGKEVKVYSIYDQRVSFCCGVHAYKHQCEKHRVRKHRTSGNNLSGGMSLGSLIRREKQALYD